MVSSRKFVVRSRPVRVSRTRRGVRYSPYDTTTVKIETKPEKVEISKSEDDVAPKPKRARKAVKKNTTVETTPEVENE